MTKEKKYKSVRQMVEVNKMSGEGKKVYPVTPIQAVYDARTGASLEAILAQFNNVFLQYQGSAAATRCLLPMELRRVGITISYRTLADALVTERCMNDVQRDNEYWGLDVNWARVDGQVVLSGELSVSEHGTWVVNGEDTGIVAQGAKGDNGLTPWLKFENNKLYGSYDKVKWDELSGLLATELRIKGYVSSYSALPSSAMQGEIWGVGPTNADTNPTYRYYVRNASGWVDNGEFTSIAAGIVQETGDGEGVVMSQKAVSGKFAELGSYQLNYYFEGNGKSYNSRAVKGIIPNHVYRVFLQNQWTISSEDIAENAFKFAVRYSLNGKEYTIVRVYINDELQTSYDFTAPEEFDYIEIGGRAEIGENVNFCLVDLALAKQLEKSINSIESRNNYPYAAYLTPRTKILSLEEDNFAGGVIKIRIQRGDYGSDFFVRGTRNNEVFDKRFIVEEKYVDENGVITFEIESGYSLVADFNTTELSVISNLEATDEYLLLASCSYGSLTRGALKNLMTKASIESNTKKINVINKELDLLFKKEDVIGLSTLQNDRYINYETGVNTSAGIATAADIYILPKEVFGEAKGIRVQCGHRSDVGAAIAFYSGKINESNYLKDKSVRGYATSEDYFYAMIPSNAMNIVITNVRTIVQNPIIELIYTDFVVESDLKDLESQVKELGEVLFDGGKDELQKTRIFIGDLINSGVQNGHIADVDTKQVVTKSVCCLPYESIKVEVKLPDGISCQFWVGGAHGVVNEYVSEWLSSGNIFEFPIDRKSYRCAFKYNNGDDILASDIKAMINRGDIAFYYNQPNLDVINRNADKDTLVYASFRKLVNGSLFDSGDNNMPIFAHISDIHGDAQRLINCMDYCDYIKVDALLATGDFSMYSYRSYCSFQEDIAENHNTPYCFCIGNHEAYPSGKANLYDDCIKNLATNEEYLVSENVITNKCYWYKDFADKKIRIIAINYYENGVYSGYLGQEQLAWFVNTLKSTPIGFGVMVLLHSPEDKVIADSPYDVFRQKNRIMDYQENGFYVGNRPISKIIDAFISRSTVDINYVEKSNDEEISIVDDFSGVDETIEFIAYVVGHRHEDWIGYYANSANKQLSLGITCGIALYGDSSYGYWANQSDLPRGGKGVGQDAFNIYAIDREQGVVKVVRIGADVTESFEDRKRMIIPYR